MSKSTFYIIDGHSMFYRAYHSPQQRGLVSPSGEPTGATYTFTRMLLGLIRDHEPDYLAMAVDGPKNLLWRRKFHPGYKRGRGDKPPELTRQLERCYEIAALLGVPILKSEEWEADDLIASVVNAIHPIYVTQGRCARDQYEYPIDLDLYLVTRDKDLMSLVSDRVKVYDGVANQMIDEEWVRKRFGVHPAQIPDYLALVGDSADCIPGVPGCGPKTAVKLLKQWTAPGYETKSWFGFCNVCENGNHHGWTLFKHNVWADISRRLVQLHLGAVENFRLESYRWCGPDLEACRSLFEQLGFNSFLRRMEERVRVKR